MSYSTASRDKHSPIGRKATIRVGKKLYVGTVIDAIERKAKRIRIQTPGERQGDVVMPGDYVLMEFE
jgi:hypothetical protein